VPKVGYVQVYALSRSHFGRTDTIEPPAKKEPEQPKDPFEKPDPPDRTEIATGPVPISFLDLNDAPPQHWATAGNA
jgi:hypothetical protein